MASVIAIVFCLTFVCTSATSDTPHCEKDAENFGNCLKVEYETHKDDNDKKLTKIWERVGQCFKDNGCDPSSSNNSALLGIKIMKKAWDDLPKDAKTCIASAHGKKALEIVNACLKDQKLDELKQPKFEQSDLDEFANKTLPHHRLIKGFQLTVLAFKKCRTEKGAKAANATLGCMVTIKQDIKEDVCKTVDKCRKDKVSDTCHQKGQKLHQALCDCGKSKLKEYIKAVQDLEDKGKEVDGDVVMAAVCKNCKDDQKAIISDVKKCFKEKNVTLGDGHPPEDGFFEAISSFLTAALHDPTGPSHAALLAFAHENPKFSKSELEDVRQVLTDILHNFDCGCTEVS